MKCGNCYKDHESVAEVKACYAKPKPEPSIVEMPPALASSKQVLFLASLAAEREWEEIPAGPVTQTVRDLLGDKEITKAAASKAIEALLELPRKPQKEQELWPDIPAGKYALKGTATISFYEVDKPTEGRWAGAVFVKLLVGAPGNWAKYRVQKGQVDGVLEAILQAGVRESAALFGEKTVSCGMCNSPLSTVRSRAAGYGETCANKYGWPYPTEAEALALLGEEG